MAVRGRAVTVTGADDCREIALQGAANFRDVGGYPAGPAGRIRWRRLFRSDSLHELTDVDVAVLRDDLRIATVIDLRSEWEAGAGGGLLAAERQVTVYKRPLTTRLHADAADAAESSLAAWYLAVLRRSTAVVRDIVGIAAASEAPVIVHCAAGKDRTGLVSALVLGALGVADDDIVADYALTAKNLPRVAARLKAMPAYHEMLVTLPENTQHARPESMTELLTGLRLEFGSIAGYLHHCGVTPEVLASLRDRLVEDARATQRTEDHHD